MYRVPIIFRDLLITFPDTMLGAGDATENKIYDSYPHGALCLLIILLLLTLHQDSRVSRWTGWTLVPMDKDRVTRMYVNSDF